MRCLLTIFAIAWRLEGLFHLLADNVQWNGHVPLRHVADFDAFDFLLGWQVLNLELHLFFRQVENEIRIVALDYATHQAAVLWALNNLVWYSDVDLFYLRLELVHFHVEGLYLLRWNFIKTGQVLS